MGRIAEVAINIPVRTIAATFSYLVPPELAFVGRGWRVRVPFGQREAEGFVVAVKEQAEAEGLKPLLSVLDNEPWFDENMLQTAEWMSNYYLCPLAEALRLFVPGRGELKSHTAYRLNEKESEPEFFFPRQISDEMREVLNHLRVKGLTTQKQLVTEFGPSVLNVLRKLERLNLVERAATSTSKFRPRFEQRLMLAVSRQEAAKALDRLTGKPAQQRLLAVLLEESELTPTCLKQHRISADTVKRLIAAGLVRSERRRVMRNSYAQLYRGTPPQGARFALTNEQRQAVAQIIAAIASREYKSFLIHGVTGSGKTQVYIEAAAAARQQGRQVIMMVPEIALTGQTVSRFKERFGEDVVVVHSRLSAGERHDAWQRIRSGEAGIVIGARSAVFAPCAKIGLIILDEEHEFTYKQEESPRYHTREVALTRARQAGAPVVLGSATPSLESYYQALSGKHILLTLSERVDGQVLPAVTVVDMREELAAGRRGVISQPLRELLTQTRREGGQAIILLNRRGYATFVLCRECGYVLRCEHCDVSLVYHATDKTIRCHYCQKTRQAPNLCPACGSRYIRYFGTGTQKVEEELAELFPEARVVRMDQDTTTGKMAHERILSAFSRGEYDILLGTQMVAKGIDIPNVTAVGIIAADTSLNLPDFRAAEKTFSLITQAAGRAGRGSRPGHVVVQTYNPEHYAIKAGAAHDYQAFYNIEAAYRRQLYYPPFGGLIKLTVHGTEETLVCRQAQNLADELKRSLGSIGKTQVVGPFPAPIAKIEDIFRMNILVKSNTMAEVKETLASMGIASRRDVILDIDPLNLL
ncbi:primosomal protein N' [Sporolituus thermophilus]|uniref:Replication restart protein PriA n=1 Tax=Sporolituus thermophilus DSM 23256 TaxID=1123285 RepID=A0A1G7KSR8_9FIRM|nr:primosomal protein N' [Sporolituus thermophilus]SDF40191.1 replication restart DNA helicase PriA [Sporolituus thermophilus DSM 23256]